MFVQRLSTQTLFFAVAMLAVFSLSIVAHNATAWGQAEEEVEATPLTVTRLLDGAPFDFLELPNKKGVQEEVHIEPLAAPPTNGGKYTVFVIHPEVPVPRRELNWESKATFIYKPWPTMLMEEALQMMKDGRTDAAYANLLHLKTNYPKTPGLDTAFMEFLFLDVMEKARSGADAEALSALEQLHRRDPKFQPAANSPPQTAMLAALGARIADDLYASKNYSVVREFIGRLEHDYIDNPQRNGDYSRLAKVIADKRSELNEQAEISVREGVAQLQADKFREARDAGRRALAIWPEVQGANEILKVVADRYKLVLVGVTQLPRVVNPVKIDDWAARRVGRITIRTLLRFQEQGPDGGEYVSPLGSVEWNEETYELKFVLRKTDSPTEGKAATVQEISNRLLYMADLDSNTYYPQWARLLQSVETSGGDTVLVQLREGHVHPRALLQEPIFPVATDVGLSASFDGPYQVGEQTSDELSFKPNPDYGDAASALRLIERRFESPQEAFSALERGEIDICDRLFPADAARIQEARSNTGQVLLGRYDLPTLHFLAPNDRNEYMKNRTFRRAIEYALNREVVLSQMLLGGRSLRGCQLISGPFPTDVPGNLGLGYAYDQRISAREWEPRLALTLAALAKQEIDRVAKLKKEPAPKLPVLVLAHPATEVARIACTAFTEQLEAVGIVVQLRELPPGEFDDPVRDYDLLYTEVTMSEPLADARRLFGKQGNTPLSGAYVNLALQHLDEARNWDQARRRLNELHRIVASEITVIPLYQIVEHFGYHRSLQGMTPRRLALYDDLSKWRIIPVEATAAK